MDFERGESNEKKDERARERAKENERRMGVCYSKWCVEERWTGGGGREELGADTTVSVIGVIMPI